MSKARRPLARRTWAWLAAMMLLGGCVLDPKQPPVVFCEDSPADAVPAAIEPAATGQDGNVGGATACRSSARAAAAAVPADLRISEPQIRRGTALTR